MTTLRSDPSIKAHANVRDLGHLYSEPLQEIADAEIESNWDQVVDKYVQTYSSIQKSYALMSHGALSTRPVFCYTVSTIWISSLSYCVAYTRTGAFFLA
jgi:hypothetical protein